VNEDELVWVEAVGEGATGGNVVGAGEIGLDKGEGVGRNVAVDEEVGDAEAADLVFTDDTMFPWTSSL